MSMKKKGNTIIELLKNQHAKKRKRGKEYRHINDDKNKLFETQITSF